MKFFMLILTLLFFNLYVYGQADSVVLGHGGGFSGEKIQYKITSGEISRGQGLITVNYHSSAKGKKRQIQCILKTALDLAGSQKPVNDPSNTYNFLYIYHHGTAVRYTWNPNRSASFPVHNFYTDILKTIDSLNFKQYEAQ